MTSKTAKIVEDALHLPRGSRAFLAEKLIESLDYEEDFGVSAKWMKEIRRRCKELDDGVVDIIPADRAFDELGAKLR
ncbi:MAG: addiction module protein [Planctomycetota bacterium]